MHVTEYLPTDSFQMLHSTIARIKGAYVPSTIQAYFADFAAFIAFNDLHHQPALAANPIIVSACIAQISSAGRSSARVRRAVVGISAIHLLDHFTDPSRNPKCASP
jgi:hypothetical protein